MIGDETVHEACPLGKHNQQSNHRQKLPLKNLTVYTFEDIKFVNTNESTVFYEVDEMDNINIDNPELKENILTGQCIGVDIKRNSLLYDMQQKSSNRSFR